VVDMAKTSASRLNCIMLASPGFHIPKSNRAKPMELREGRMVKSLQAKGAFNEDIHQA
jgi:hypothetical protein